MPKPITTKIPDLSTPWENYSGERVEELIKEQIAAAKEAAADSLQGVKVNGQTASRDTDGHALIEIERISVDQSLDTTSHNAIENAVVAAKLNEIEDGIPASMDTDASPTDPDNMLQLTIYNKGGGVIAQTDIPKGNAETTISRAYVTASIDRSRVKLGSNAVLSWSYDHKTDGETDGIPSGITIRVRCGNTVTYESTTPDVSPGTTGRLDLRDYLRAGTTEVYVIAHRIDGSGNPETRQAYAAVMVATLELTSSFDIAATLTDGGYGNDTTVAFPCYVEGSGAKAITVYVDGTQVATETVQAQSKNTTFYVHTNGLNPGRHNIQVVAESDGIRSQSLYRDILIQGGNTPYIGCEIDFDDGRIYEQPPIIPTIEARQFDTAKLTFVAWTPGIATSTVEVQQNGETVSTMQVGRTRQSFDNQYTTGGTLRMALVTGVTEYPFYFRIEAAADILVEEATPAVVRLLAAGRSNTEANPADWGGITTFEGVDWQSSGWAKRTATDSYTGQAQTFDVLRLINGAKATIDHKPFRTDARVTGKTIEMELFLSNVSNRDAHIISCINEDGIGFWVSAKEAMLDTGQTQMLPTPEVDGQGNPIYRERPIGVYMDIASGMLVRLSFVIDTQSDNPTRREGNNLILLYINGILSRVDRYTTGFNFIHRNNPRSITIDSTFADVDIRSVRVYERALSPTEVLDNYIADRPTYNAISEAYSRNDVVNATTGEIDIDKILAKGRGAMVIIPQSNVNNANATNNKKQDFDAAVVKWYSPLGEQYDFTIRNCVFRIQGTSSTKYPRKNYRLYLAKTASGHDISETTLTVGASRSDGMGGIVANPNIKDGKIKGNKYALRPDGEPANLFCMKADYSDSSMTMNTGGARLFNDIMKELGLLTPPQRYQADNGETVTKRQAIDGIPCDLFVAETEGDRPTYYGQYNLNNEKSKSEEIFGMKAFGDFDPECSFALESLNNDNPFCLFQSNGSADSDSLEQQLLQSFDDGFEFNYPEDNYYSPAKAAEENCAVAADKYKQAIRRLMGWLYDVTPAAVRTMDDAHAYGDTNLGIPFDPSLWVSQRFRDEAADYFDIQHLCTYYLLTDYWASVDQRAKNILWRTWDGLKWYSTFYDGDTAMSIRNDGFMAYLYDMTRDTYDDEGLKYAFEGHNSRLWCLVLANFEAELRSAAESLRSRLGTARMLQVFNGEQMHNWSERQYNESGWFKYVMPRIEGVPLKDEQGNTVNTIYNYLYALNGSREAHRTSFLTLRSALLDAKYQTSIYIDDCIKFYLAKDSANTQDIRILSGDLYYYGYKRNNGGFIKGPVLAAYGDTCTLGFDETFIMNDPLNLCGASRIMELDWTGGPVLAGNFDMQKCAMLQSLNMSAENGGTRHNTCKFVDIAKCTMLHSLDITGQVNTSTENARELDLRAQTRLASLRAGGTMLLQVLLAEGAPVTTLVLPATIQRLTLRYLPELRTLNMEGYAAVTHFNFAGCPHLDWQQILAQCTNVQYIRVEGIRGKIHPDMLRRYTALGGIDEQGNIDPQRPRLAGSVMLTQVVTDAELASLRAAYPELTISQCQYSHYWFDDMNADPANITNEDNHTGAAYYDGSVTYPTNTKEYYVRNYQPSGHVLLLREKSQLCTGHINPVTRKMHVKKIDHGNLLKYADGTQSVLTGDDNMDVFLYLPRYWYKGVNDYKNAHKHFFLCAFDECPGTDAAYARYRDMDAIRVAGGKGIYTAAYQGGGIDGIIVDYAGASVYRVPVGGMRQARFPGLNSPMYGFAFTDGGGTVIGCGNLQTPAESGNPADFMNEEGDYDFRDVPDGAEYLYFTCLDKSAARAHAEVVVTDSADIDAIEPDWVEHLPELIGGYQGSADGITLGGTATSGLRSISGKTPARGGSTSQTSTAWQYDAQGDPSGPLPPSTPIALDGTAQDLFNLAGIRNAIHNVQGGSYSAVTYETSKDMANIIMAWHGTRDVEQVAGKGRITTQMETGGQDTTPFDTTAFGNTDNKMWGLEKWTGSLYEWTDKVCCHAPSFASFKANRRNAPAGSTVDYYYNIAQRDGSERRVKAASASQATNVARVRFGRHCDVIASAYAGDTSYATCYAAQQGQGNTQTGRVIARSYSEGSVRAGVVSLSSLSESYAYRGYTTRLCFQGEIENEPDLTP